MVNLLTDVFCKVVVVNVEVKGKAHCRDIGVGGVEFAEVGGKALIDMLVKAWLMTLRKMAKPLSFLYCFGVNLPTFWARGQGAVK